MQHKISKKEIDDIITLFKFKLEEIISKKGDLSFNSPHEIRGALDEEIAEHLDALRADNLEDQVNELFDVATVSIWGIVSILGSSNE
jgi:arsenate reductase-like glutaredoxin family protein